MTDTFAAEHLEGTLRTVRADLIHAQDHAERPMLDELAQIVAHIDGSLDAIGRER